MAKIRIEFYPEAQDDMDVEATNPEFVYMADDVKQAEEKLALIQRKIDTPKPLPEGSEEESI